MEYRVTISHQYQIHQQAEPVFQNLWFQESDGLDNLISVLKDWNLFLTFLNFEMTKTVLTFVGGLLCTSMISSIVSKFNLIIKTIWMVQCYFDLNNMSTFFLTFSLGFTL